MKLSTKAALFSGLIFPGAGYFLLKRTWHGVVAIIIVISTLFVLVTEATYKAQLIAEKIISGALPFDPTVITSEIANTPGKYNTETISLMTAILVTVWLISIIDCYRVGKKHEEK